MDSLETELERAYDLDVTALADAIESIGFECTDCGHCCRGSDDDHTATVFPDEVRDLQTATESAWRDVARPMPYGLSPGSDGTLEGVTFEWALQTNGCGDCTFYDGGDTAAAREDDGTDTCGGCSVYDHRPLICRTYPFSVSLAGTSQPLGTAVEESGMVRAHECEGLGREIDRDDALALARTVKTRAIRELEEAIGVRDAYDGTRAPPSEILVYDSEGSKTLDGAVYRNG